MTEIEKLEQAIAALEAQRDTLGNDVVEAALIPLREKLAELETHRSLPQHQRKLLTVLFTDIVGSTQMSRDRDPEEILEIMDGALKSLAIPVEAHGGRVTRYMGDGFKAIFGLPLAHENDAVQAVRAGLGILEVARSYGKELERESGIANFNVRVGINTGLVATGGFSEAEDTIMGVTVNLGARMESAAPPGGLLISHYTYLHVRGAFDVAPLEPISAKGFQEPVPVYLVKSAKPRAFRTGTRGVRGILTPTLGRDAELKQLQDTFNLTMAESTTHIITILGDPGVGKSRLLDEFTHWIDSRLEPIRYFKGRARQQMMGTPYGLLRDLFTERYEILDSDPAPVVRQKLKTGLEHYLLDEPQMKAHFIGALLGYEFAGSPFLSGVKNDPEQLRDRAMFYLTQFFTSLAQQVPLTILLEDIHWADESSLDALQKIVQKCSHLQLLIICLARPGLLDNNRQGYLEQTIGDAKYSQINLQPLSPHACRQLVDEILKKADSFPQILRDQIVSTAEGNPFYLEELINILIDDGIIQTNATQDVWGVNTSDLNNLRIPPTLTALVQARLDSLTLAEKIVLQQSSVIGRVFWEALLGAIQGTGKPPRQELAALSQRELIYLNDHSAFAPAEEYIFKHTMTREVTYETVLKRVRKAYHGQVAAWLVEATRASGRVEEYAALIAEHYELAGETSAASEWYLRGAERASSQGAFKEARQFFDCALELLPSTDLEARWRALLGRDEVLGILGETEARLADDIALVALAQELNDDSRLADAYARQAYFVSITGDERRALELYEAGLAAARRADNIETEALTLSLMTVCQTRLGDLGQAASVAGEALKRAQDLDNDKTMAMILTNVAILYTESGDFARGVQLLNQQLEICQRTGNRLGEAIGLSNLGYDYIFMGLYPSGQDALEKSLQIFESIGAPHWKSFAQLNLGITYLRCGNSRAARQILEKTTSELVNTGDAFAQAVNQSYLGLTLEQSGDVARAMDCFNKARSILGEISMPSYANDALAGLARCYLALEYSEEAQQCGIQVCDYLKQHGSKGMEFPILAYQTCADIFEVLDDTENSSVMVRAGYLDLMERAGKISDLTWRQSFLENVPEHRALLERWERLKV